MLGIGTKDWPLFTYNVIVKSGQIKMVTTIPSLSLGSQISSNLAATFWTYFCVLTLCILNFSGANQGLLQELGLRVLPDVSKINISLDEYTRMMNLYLQSREESGQDESVPKLVTFKLDRKLVRDNDKYPTVILRFPVAPQLNVELESAELKLLVPPQLENVPSPKVQVNIILGNRRKELIRERTFYLSQEGPKWCTADITSAVQSWLRGDVNLGLELVCLDSNCILDPLEAAVTSLIHTPQSRRVRRESPYEPKHKTTCRDTGSKHRCCRQSMNVTFSELGLEQEQIVRPQVYDAGYCTGMCPPNYLHSYNHTYIQSIMRRRERRNHKALRKVIPKACCAPLKLSSVSFLVIDPDYPSTMVMRLWENMAVEECGCS